MNKRKILKLLSISILSSSTAILPAVTTILNNQEHSISNNSSMQRAAANVTYNENNNSWSLPSTFGTNSGYDNQYIANLVSAGKRGFLLPEPTGRLNYIDQASGEIIWTVNTNGLEIAFENLSTTTYSRTYSKFIAVDNQLKSSNKLRLYIIDENTGKAEQKFIDFNSSSYNFHPKATLENVLSWHFTEDLSNPDNFYIYPQGKSSNGSESKITYITLKVGSNGFASEPTIVEKTISLSNGMYSTSTLAFMDDGNKNYIIQLGKKTADSPKYSLISYSYDKNTTTLTKNTEKEVDIRVTSKDPFGDKSGPIQQSQIYFSDYSNSYDFVQLVNNEGARESESDYYLLRYKFNIETQTLETPITVNFENKQGGNGNDYIKTKLLNGWISGNSLWYYSSKTIDIQGAEKQALVQIRLDNPDGSGIHNNDKLDTNSIQNYDNNNRENNRINVWYIVNNTVDNITSSNNGALLPLVTYTNKVNVSLFKYRSDDRSNSGTSLWSINTTVDNYKGGFARPTESRPSNNDTGLIESNSSDNLGLYIGLGVGIPVLLIIIGIIIFILLRKKQIQKNKQVQKLRTPPSTIKALPGSSTTSGRLGVTGPMTQGPGQRPGMGPGMGQRPGMQQRPGSPQGPFGSAQPGPGQRPGVLGRPGPGGPQRPGPAVPPPPPPKVVLNAPPKSLAPKMARRPN